MDCASTSGTMVHMKRALITGISGQDGSYLAELLYKKGYEIHGIVRHTSNGAPQHLVNLQAIDSIVTLHEVSLDNGEALKSIVSSVKPDECYHLAASSFVSYGFADESALLNANFNLTHSILSALREASPGCRFYFAGSSEMFGYALEAPQNEQTTFRPRSLYGIAKLASYHLVNNYRLRYNMFASTGILYNHESPRRSFEFVTRKVTSTVAKIKTGKRDSIVMGNIDAVRDWGYAPDYVEAMWMMMQAEKGDDYVVATGVIHSVQELLECAFSVVGLHYQDYLKIDQEFYRESESVSLCGDSTKIRTQLGWKPTKTFEEIIQEMVEADLILES